MKRIIGTRLRDILINNKSDDYLYNKMFCINLKEELYKYRIGYYYGAEIVREMNCYMDIKLLLLLKVEYFISYINKYFEICIL